MPDRKLAIFLGPYRNLSTLTAAVLSLHPDVQVLNHAGERLWADEGLDFFKTPDQPTFNRFMDAAWSASAGGQRGALGGSILHSHAFDDASVRDLYRARFGDATVKPDARWLVWKESMRVQSRLMAEPGLFDLLCEQFPDLRFILPVRSPLDCAASNTTGHRKSQLQLPPEASEEVVLEAVLDVFAWALARRADRPDRFFAFTQYDETDTVLRGLANVLGLPAGPDWLADARAAFIVRERTHTRQEILHADTRMKERLGPWPEFAQSLLQRLPRANVRA